LAVPLPERLPEGFGVGQEHPQAVHAEGQAVLFPAGNVARADGWAFGRLATAETGLNRGLRFGRHGPIVTMKEVRGSAVGLCRIGASGRPAS
jgi:hypothetical protein